MKTILLRLMFIGSVLLLSGCAHTPYARRSAGRVLFPPGHLSPWGATPVWIPSEADVVACEAALGRALAKRGKDLARYNVRMCGTQSSAARLIVGDACDIAVPGAAGYLTPPDGGSVVLATFGGGEAFFSFEFDLVAQKLTRFQFNAPL